MDNSVGGNSATISEAAPASFAEAFASDVSPASDTASQSSTPPAAEQPGTPEAASPQQTDERSPFIPRTRFDEVNTERNTLKQQVAEWQQYEWAKSVDRVKLQQAQELATKYQTDRVGFITELLQHAQGDPHLGPQLRSLAARTLAQGRGQAAGPEMPQPDVAIYDSAGNVTGHTYSDKALAQRDQWLISQVMNQVDERFAPRFKTVEDIAKEREVAQVTAQAERQMTSFMQELQALPGFTPDVGKAIAADLAQVQFADDAHPSEVNAAAYRSYVKHAVTNLGQKAESALLDNLQKKAAASSSVNPGTAAPSSPADVKSFHDTRLSWR